jgi:hypothetical protein
LASQALKATPVLPGLPVRREFKVLRALRAITEPPVHKVYRAPPEVPVPAEVLRGLPARQVLPVQRARAEVQQGPRAHREFRALPGIPVQQVRRGPLE